MSNTTPPTPGTTGTPAASSTTASSTTAPLTKRKGAARFITPALVLVAVLGVGIFGGVLIGQNTSESTQAGGAGGFGGGEMPTGGGTAPDGATGGAGGGFTSGTVVSVDGSTIVLETSDGEQVTITASEDTTVTTTEDSSVDALAEGDELTVVGEADDAGDVTATSISEGATMGFGGGMGGGTPPTGTEDDATE
jgi:hypothetical protein